MALNVDLNYSSSNSTHFYKIPYNQKNHNITIIKNDGNLIGKWKITKKINCQILPINFSEGVKHLHT